MTDGLVEHIHVAPDAAAPVRSLFSVEVRAGVGLPGDRYAAGRGHYSHDRRVSRDLTMVASEALDVLRQEHGMDLAPGETRRNLTTRGIDLEGLIGRRFYVGEVLCVGTGACRPCQYLADLVGKPLVRPMAHRGGLRADVLSDGVITVGDVVRLAPRAEIVLGTMNDEKARQCELALRGLDLEVKRLSEVAPDAPAAGEPSDDPVANARDKAHTYARLVGLPTLAIDFALFFDGLESRHQPGAFVRRFDRSVEERTDDEVLRHYSELIQRRGGVLDGRWHVGMALATPDRSRTASITVARTFVATPSRTRLPGYPLASLQIDANGRSISEFDSSAYPEIIQPLRRFVATGLASL